MARTDRISMSDLSTGESSRLDDTRWRRPRQCRWFAAAALSVGLASCAPEPSAPTPPKTPTTVDSSARTSATPRPPVQAPKPAEHARNAATTASADNSPRQAILGVWKQDKTGTRWLRFRPDGTGTMFIEPNWVAKRVIGDSLTMHIKWHINDDGHAVMTSTSGTPEGAYQAVTNLYGDERVRTIVTLNDNQLVFRDEEDDSLSKWQRPDPNEKPPKAIAKQEPANGRDKNE